MAKPKYKFNVRDVIIGLLTVALIISYYIMFQMYANQNITNEGSAQAILQSEYQIAKLKSCVDNHTSPCDITTGMPQNDIQ